MLIKYARDGEKFNRLELENDNFFFSDKDINQINEEAYNINNSKYTAMYNFVGFQFNKSNDALVIFPKGYRIEDIEYDSKLIFKLISKHMLRYPEYYFGNENDLRFYSNYPFLSFFNIYDYYIKHGLFFENKINIKENTNGKLNWKKTIKDSNKLVLNNNIMLFPIYYNKSFNSSNFLTECIVFVINHTLDKFGFLIEYDKINIDIDLEIFRDITFVTEQLLNLKSSSFKDSITLLIDDLIRFFMQFNEGGPYFFKHYFFSYIWEDIVKEYLNNYFIGFKNDQAIFSLKRENKYSFDKEIFKPNLINSRQFMAPDYYYIDENNQYIFDAKYFTSLIGIDYKQIVYYLLLKNYNDLNNFSRIINTITALILPDEKISSSIYFYLDPKFGFKDLIINEIRLDIKDVISKYLNI